MISLYSIYDNVSSPFTPHRNVRMWVPRCLLVALLSFGVLFAGTTGQASATNSGAKQSQLITVCVNTKASTLRLSQRNTCAYDAEYKLVWSPRGTAPMVCINTSNREMTLAFANACPSKGTRLARTRINNEILACADKDSGLMRWPVLGVCWWENTSVKWLVAPPTSASLLEGSAGVARAPGTGGVVVNGRVTDLKVTFGDNNSASINYLNKLIVNIAGNSPAGASTVATGSTSIRVYRNQTVEITGSGYAPSTSVDVWMNSTPIELGSTMSDTNGLISGLFGIPANIDIGNHTITMSGKLDNGTTAKVSVGIEVVDTQTVTPTQHTTAITIAPTSTTSTTIAPTSTTIAPVAGPAFTLSSSSESKAQNVAIAGYTISSTGGVIASYAISPSAPTGTSFSTSTGLLSGTPSTVQGATVYTITATNATSTATRTFTLTVTLAAPAFTLSSSSESKAQNVAIAGYTISSTGGVIASYAISPSAPTGTSFSTSTGLLSGTPSTVQGATVYTITATNATSTATRTFTLTVTALTCANGGSCTVGVDTGPGGGIVFYYSASAFTSTGSACGINCHYLEAAPNGWNSTPASLCGALSTDPICPYSNLSGTAIGATAQGFVIGTGYANTTAIIGQGSTAGHAATSARAYQGGSQTDWFLPSKDELNELCKYARNQTTGTTSVACSSSNSLRAGFSSDMYWSSSETDPILCDARWHAWTRDFSNGLSQCTIYKTGGKFIRPVRAFG